MMEVKEVLNAKQILQMLSSSGLSFDDMWVHSPPLGAQANFNRMRKA